MATASRELGHAWSGGWVALATLATLVGFAANSLLCRAALAGGHADPMSFSAIRLAAGAAALGVLVGRRGAGGGSWASALALLAYALAFSLAYVRLEAGVGAFLLFGCVQVTMIGWGLKRGERPHPGEWLGLAVALAGLAWLGLPGARLEDRSAAGMMALAGVAWGIYSLRGRASRAPVEATAGNFWRAALAAVLLAAAATGSRRVLTWTGAALGILSGAVTSGLVYALWYAVLPRHSATRAALVQLAVPAIAMAGSVAFLGERVAPRALAAAAAILAGVVVALAAGRHRRTARPDSGKAVRTG